MTKIKGKISDIKEMINLVRLEGKDPDGSNISMMEGAILECKNGKINICCLAKTSTVLCFISFNKVDVIGEGEIPVGNLEILLSYLSRFENDDVVTIETADNKIKVVRDSPKKTALIPMTARENVEDSLRAEAVKDSLTQENGIWKFRTTLLPATIKVNTSFINKVLGDGNVENLNRKYPFIIDDEVICKVGDDRSGMIESVIPVESKSGKGSSSYAAGIDNVFSNLSDVVEVCLADNGPMLVVSKNDRYEAKFIIAPLINED